VDMMKQLRQRIIRMLEDGAIADEKERQKLEYLLKTKKWNPYCLRHSAISSDSDYLSGYGLNKKVRWSMNSKQPSRYIKRRMGNDLKKQILVHDGIISNDEIQRTKSALTCPRCNLANAVHNKYCSKCGYPLIPSAFDEIKEAENMKFNMIEKNMKK
jgi:integrase/recombinase XerD